MVRRRTQKSPPDPRNKMLSSSFGRVPRFNIRGTISDTTVLSGNRRTSETTASGNGHSTFQLDINTLRPTDVISSVGQHYRQYKYLPGTTLNWVPSVSLTTTGTVTVAYIDSPELMVAWSIIVSESDRNTFVQSIGNAKTFPIWREWSYPMPGGPLRRNLFDIDATPGTATNDVERQRQGQFIVQFTGVPGTPTIADGTIIARPYLHQKVMLKGLNAQTTGG